VAIRDPNPLVAGRGIQRLINAGVEVEIGTLSKQAEELNKRFFTRIKKNRPFIILKWAQTSDGFTAPLNRDRTSISNEQSRQLVHKWRTEEDAIMIGSETAIRDNPLLNARDWAGRNPVRIVIDRYLRLPPTLNIFKGDQKTICYNLKTTSSHEQVKYVKVTEEYFLHDVLENLAQQRIQSVIVEGGPALLTLFINAELWDEARIFYSPIQFGQGIEAPLLKGEVITREKIQDDRLEILSNKEG